MNGVCGRNIHYLLWQLDPAIVLFPRRGGRPHDAIVAPHVAHAKLIGTYRRCTRLADAKRTDALRAVILLSLPCPLFPGPALLGGGATAAANARLAAETPHKVGLVPRHGKTPFAELCLKLWFSQVDQHDCFLVGGRMEVVGW